MQTQQRPPTPSSHGTSVFVPHEQPATVQPPQAPPVAAATQSAPAQAPQAPPVTAAAQSAPAQVPQATMIYLGLRAKRLSTKIKRHIFIPF